MIFNNLLRNKRGDVSITLLVIMTLVLCGISLYIFVYYNSNVNAKISDVSKISSFYSEAEGFEFFLKDIALGVVKEVKIPASQEAGTNTLDIENQILNNFKDSSSKAVVNMDSYKNYAVALRDDKNYDIEVFNGMVYLSFYYGFSKDFSSIQDTELRTITLRRKFSVEIPLPEVKPSVSASGAA